MLKSGFLGKRLLIVAALAAATAATLPAEAKTKISVMHQGTADWVQTYKQVAAAFEAANPDYEVELIYAPHDSYNEKLGAAITAKQLPDIIELDAPFLANYVWSKYVVPISPYIDPAILADMTASNVAQGTYPIDNKLYAIGLADSSIVLYGNRKYLEQIGARIPTGVDDAWTREELEAVMAKLAKVDGVKWPLDLFRGYGIKSEWVTYAFSTVLQSMGCDLIDRKTWKATGTLDSEPCVKAARMLQDWAKAGMVVPQSAGTNQFYAQGNPAALAMGGHWFYAEAQKAMGDNIVVMPLPKFGDKAVSPNGTWIWAITSAAKNPEAAGKFLSYFLASKTLRDQARSQSAYPGLKSFAASSPLYAPGGAMAVAFDQADKTAVARPPHPAYPTITVAFMEAMDTIFNGGDPKKALNKAARKIDEEIEDNAGYPPFGTK